LRDDIGIADSDVRLSTAPKFAEFGFMMDKELVRAEFVSKEADDKAAEERKEKKKDSRSDKEKEKDVKAKKKRRAADKAKKLERCDTVRKVLNTFLKCYRECGALNLTALRNDGYIKNVTHVDQALWEYPTEGEDDQVSKDNYSHLIQFGQMKMLGDPRKDPHAAHLDGIGRKIWIDGDGSGIIWEGEF